MFDPISLKCAHSGTRFVQEPSTGNIPPGICQARNQDFMWGGANEAKADPTTEMYFLSSDSFI